MPSIQGRQLLTHPSLPGVRIYPFQKDPTVGEKQMVIVEVEPNGSIPLHTHTVDAEMLIVGGDGWVCSTDEANGRHVAPGYRVFYEKDRPHGFRAGKEGLTFVSINGGIVDRWDHLWDMRMIDDQPSGPLGL